MKMSAMPSHRNVIAEFDHAEACLSGTDCDSVGRLLSLSLGQTSLCRDTWLRAKHIDMLRRGRMEQHKRLNGNEP